ncbi:hypothetical protein ABPG72_022002 [Tetrahymena utriculariae]
MNNKLKYYLYYPPHSLCSPPKKLLYKIKFNIIYYFLFDLVEIYLKLMCQMKQISRQVNKQINKQSTANQIPLLNQNILPIIYQSIFQILITIVSQSKNKQINNQIKNLHHSHNKICVYRFFFLLKNSLSQLVNQLVNQEFNYQFKYLYLIQNSYNSINKLLQINKQITKQVSNKVNKSDRQLDKFLKKMPIYYL